MLAGKLRRVAFKMLSAARCQGRSGPGGRGAGAGAGEEDIGVIRDLERDRQLLTGRSSVFSPWQDGI